MHRLRFAPSPTGYLHVGGARTALFNWLYARHYGGEFLLRIEDTDKARSTEDSTKAIFDGLNWLGLKWDKEVVFQGARATTHLFNALELVQTGHAYPCFCTPEELEQQRELQGTDRFIYPGTCRNLSPAEQKAKCDANIPSVIRFKVPTEGETAWDDVVHGRIAFPNKDLGGDFIIIRSDRSPIYNLAVVSDDIHMKITMVLRGDDHISNTPKQILLYEAMGAKVPQFGHLPMIHGEDGKKLSKRHGATAVGDYAKLGILPDAMLNFLALLGWSPGNDLEVMSLEEMIDKFSVEGLSKKAAIFGMKKLEWMNRQHLELMPTSELTLMVLHEMHNYTYGSGVIPRISTLKDVVVLLRSRARSLTELAQQALEYLAVHPIYDTEAVNKVWADPDKVIAVLTQTLAELETTGKITTTKETAQIIRVALVGKTISPPLDEIVATLGVPAAKERIRHSLEKNLRLVHTYTQRMPL
jgi:glutamyl-tRNA synthetase